MSNTTATTVTLTLAPTHFFDWLSRFDGEEGKDLIRLSELGARLTKVEFGPEALEDFVSDAKHYGDKDAENLFDGDYLPVIKSARANLRRLEKAGLLNYTAPEQPLEDTTTTEGTDMSKTYTLVISLPDGTLESAEYGSKKTAIKYGELSGESFTVVSPSGATVHTHLKPLPETSSEDLEQIASAVERAQGKPEPVVANGLTVKTGRKWTDIFDSAGNKVAGIRTDQVDAVLAALAAR